MRRYLLDTGIMGDLIGRVMQIVDMKVAAIAFAFSNCTVVTNDSDLSAAQGLQVENWATA